MFKDVHIYRVDIGDVEEVIAFANNYLDSSPHALGIFYGTRRNTCYTYLIDFYQSLKPFGKELIFKSNNIRPINIKVHKREHFHIEESKLPYYNANSLIIRINDKFAESMKNYKLERKDIVNSLIRKY